MTAFVTNPKPALRAYMTPFTCHMKPLRSFGVILRCIRSKVMSFSFFTQTFQLLICPGISLRIGRGFFNRTR